MPVVTLKGPITKLKENMESRINITTKAVITERKVGVWLVSLTIN